MKLFVVLCSILGIVINGNVKLIIPTIWYVCSRLLVCELWLIVVVYICFVWVSDDKSQLDLKPFNDSSTLVTNSSGMLIFFIFFIVTIATLVSSDSAMHDR